MLLPRQSRARLHGPLRVAWIDLDRVRVESWGSVRGRFATDLGSRVGVGLAGRVGLGPWPEGSAL